MNLRIGGDVERSKPTPPYIIGEEHQSVPNIAALFLQEPYCLLIRRLKLIGIIIAVHAYKHWGLGCVGLSTTWELCNPPSLAWSPTQILHLHHIK